MLIKSLRTLVLVAMVVGVATAAFAGEETRKMAKSAFFVMDHMGGALAVNMERVVSVFYLPGSADKPARFRMNLARGADKTVDGPQAEPIWKALREGGFDSDFIWVSHMNGTLGIPVRNIQSVFKKGEGPELSLRINHDGDPQGKTLKGEEAAKVWKRLTE